METKIFYILSIVTYFLKTGSSPNIPFSNIFLTGLTLDVVRVPPCSSFSSTPPSVWDQASTRDPTHDSTLGRPWVMIFLNHNSKGLLFLFQAFWLVFPLWNLEYAEFSQSYH